MCANFDFYGGFFFHPTMYEIMVWIYDKNSTDNKEMF